jgi:hypothetical protein
VTVLALNEKNLKIFRYFAILIIGFGALSQAIGFLELLPMQLAS